jgi:hypothetical protein
LVCELLQHRVADRGQPLGAEVGEGSVVERLPVGPEGGGFVGVSASCPDRPLFGCGQPEPSRV